MSMLGVANGGLVYAIADYTANTTDEISFSAGDQLTVIQKGDKQETRWWWAKHRDGDTGYIPQNLVTVRTPAVWPYLYPGQKLNLPCRGGVMMGDSKSGKNSF